MRNWIIGALAAAGIGGAALLGNEFAGDPFDYKCPDETYTRTQGTDPDTKEKFTVCTNDDFIVAARESAPGQYKVTVFDQRTGTFVTE